MLCGAAGECGVQVVLGAVACNLPDFVVGISLQYLLRTRILENCIREDLSRIDYVRVSV